MAYDAESSASKSQQALTVQRRLKLEERELASARTLAWKALSTPPRDSPVSAELSMKKSFHRADLLFQESLSQLRQDAGQQQDRSDEKRLERVAALIELRASVLSSSSRLQKHLRQKAAASKYQQKTQKEEEQALRAQGKNPYEIFRKRNMDEGVLQNKTKQKTAIEWQKSAIRKRLRGEKRSRLSRLDQQQMHELAIHRYQQEMGRAAAEQRCNRPMQQHTTEHLPLVDPTGRLPLVPSKAVTAVDKGFGLGHASQQAILLEEARWPDAGLTRALLPHKLRPSEVFASCSANTSATGPMLAQDDKALAGNQRSGTASLEDAGGIRSAKWPFASLQEQIGAQGAPDFSALPPSVIFKDAEAGKRYTCEVLLTNVSGAPASFKVRGPSVASCQWLDVQWKPSGALAAGRSSKVRVCVHIPETDGIEALEGSIEVATVHGLLKIPVTCIPMEFSARPEQKEIIFSPGHGTVVGKACCMPILIRNTGGVPAQMTLQSDKTTDVGDPLAGLSPFSLTPMTATVPGHSSLTVQARFAPTRPGPAQQQLAMQLAPATGTWEATSASVMLSGQGLPEPIQLQAQIIDLKCCIIGRTYSVPVTIINGSQLAAKASLAFPDWLTAHISCSSSSSLCQAGRDFTFQLAFRPKAALLLRLQQQDAHTAEQHDANTAEQQNTDAAELKMPGKVQVQGQKKALNFSIVCRLTEPGFSMSPSQLDFGDALMHEQTGREVMVTNSSLLAQDIGFPSLPPFIHMRPEGGLTHLLPKESASITVWYTPASSGHQEPFQLLCRGSLGASQRLRCSAFGLRSPLLLYSTDIKMPATIPGGISEGRFTITNSSKLQQSFHLSGMVGMGLQLCPVVAHLAPGKSMAIMVRHAAPLPPQPSQPAPAAPAAPPPATHPKAGNGPAGPGQPKQPAAAVPAQPLEAKAGKASAAISRPATPAQPPTDEAAVDALAKSSAPSPPAPFQADDLLPQSPKALAQQRHLLTCHVKPTGDSSAAAIAMRLAVSTTVVEPTWTLDGEVRPDAALGCYVLDFGQCPLGSQASRLTCVQNNNRQPLTLSARALDPFGPFYLHRALRSAPPMGTAQVALGFSPQAPGACAEMVILQVDRHQLRILLKGEGIEKAPEPKLPEKTKKGGPVSPQKK
ncbi:hypothetical protein WJX84_009166 [Apatococcus fuscideae]|uniref:Uncharacterized protein n=1 Tax=Apatococcus fuscideae TaxID=2026836 RepID=A0AAW1TK22_9CHLO